MEVLDILKLNIIQRHNFFQSFASIGRVDLVYMLPDKPKMQLLFSSVRKFMPSL